MSDSPPKRIGTCLPLTALINEKGINESGYLAAGISFSRWLSQTGQTIYFLTEGAVYRSRNAGIDWTVLAAPASGTPQALLLSLDSSDVIFVGFTTPPKK